MSPRVLIAESSATLQALVRVTLEGDRLQVECVADGRSALSSLRANPPDLLICDASLAGIDGYGVVEVLRQHETADSVPVLLLASDHESPDADRLDHLGIQDLLTKPFEQHDLLERVRGLLGTTADSLHGKAPDTVAPASTTERGWEQPAALAGGGVPPPDEDTGRVIEAWLRGEGRSVVDAALREVIWKVVPELAEAQIRHEIRRLTESADVEPSGGSEDEDP